MHVESAIRKENEPQGLMAVPPANSNRPLKRKRRARLPMPPETARDVEQQLMAADEFWNQLISTVETNDGKGSGAALAMFSCFVHSLISDRELCKQLILYFDKKLNDDFISREVLSS
jgi:hypothetical protein